MLAGNQDNGTVWRNGPSMSDWTKVGLSDGGMTYLFETPSAVWGFASHQATSSLVAPAIFRSTSPGSGTFSGSISSGIDPPGPHAFHLPYQPVGVDPDHILAGTDRVFKTMNGGSTWTDISGDVTGESTAAIRALAIAPSDSSVVYVATNDYTTAAPREPNARVLFSTNGGVNFTETDLTPHPGWRRITRELFVDPTNAQTLYVARARFGDPIGPVLRTQNGGSTFQHLDPNNTFPDVPVNTILADVRSNAIVLYAGTDAGLYYSVNEGGTWHHFTGMPNAIIVDIVLDDRGLFATDRLVIGTHGRGIWSVEIDPPVDFGTADFNQDGWVNELDVAAFEEGLLKGDVYAIDGDLTTGPRVGDLLDLAAFMDAWMAAR